MFQQCLRGFLKNIFLTWHVRRCLDEFYFCVQGEEGLGGRLRDTEGKIQEAYRGGAAYRWAAISHLGQKETGRPEQSAGEKD